MWIGQAYEPGRTIWIRYHDYDDSLNPDKFGQQDNPICHSALPVALTERRRPGVYGPPMQIRRVMHHLIGRGASWNFPGIGLHLGPLSVSRPGSFSFVGFVGAIEHPRIAGE